MLARMCHHDCFNRSLVPPDLAQPAPYFVAEWEGG
jgi:hypothetical protein